MGYGKSLGEMDFNEKLSWACGTVIIGIGDGKFRSAMGGVILGLTQEGYNRGKKAGVEEQKAKQKRRRSKR